MVIYDMLKKAPTKKNENTGTLERDYGRLFLAGDDKDIALSYDLAPRLSPYKSILTVTTYGAYEEPI